MQMPRIMITIAPITASTWIARDSNLKPSEQSAEHASHDTSHTYVAGFVRSKNTASWTSALFVFVRKSRFAKTSQPTKLCEPRPASIKHVIKPYAVAISASLMSQKRPLRNGAACAKPNEPNSGKAAAVFVLATFLVKL